MSKGVSKRDYYEVLGVSRTATDVEIKSAYRKLAMKHHPDRNPGNAKSEEQFKAAAEAYAVLADSEKRSLYDRFGHAGVGSAAGGGRRVRSERVRRVRRLWRHPRQHVRVRRLFGGGRRGGPAARGGSAVRPRDHLRGIGAGRRDHHSDSAPGTLRDVPRLGRSARLVADHLSAMPRTRPGPLPAGLLHRRPDVSAVPRRRPRHHQAVRDVSRRGHGRARAEAHREDSAGHRQRTAASTAGRRRSGRRRRAGRPSLRRHPRPGTRVLPAGREQSVLRNPRELHDPRARRRNPGADARWAGKSQSRGRHAKPERRCGCAARGCRM